MGESHVYDIYSSRVTAEEEHGTLAFLDVTHLTPASLSPKRLGLLGKFDVLGTLHLLTATVPARDLSDHFHSLIQGQPEILGGVSELPSGRGVTVRVLGPRAEPVAAALQAVLITARATLLELPPPTAPPC
jgi:urease accessory protein UreH